MSEGTAAPPKPSEARKLAAVRAYERARITARRKLYGIDPPNRDGSDLVALALSGGGIRSATFSLGVLRELSALGLLQRLDYLSTVSGGSYIGAFLGGLYAKRDKQPGPLSNSTAHDPLGSKDAANAMNWLRQNGRYLAPSGVGDLWYALVVLLRNWIGVQLVIGLALLLLALGAVGLRIAFDGFDAIARVLPQPAAQPALSLDWHGHHIATLPPPPIAAIDWGALVGSPLLKLALLPLLLTFALGWAYWLTRREAASKRAQPVPALAATVLLVTTGLALVVFGTLHYRVGGGVVALTGVIAFAAWWWKAYGWLSTAPGMKGDKTTTRSWWSGAWLATAPNLQDGKTDVFKLARAWDLVRHDLTNGQAMLSRWTAVLVLAGLVDGLALLAWQISAGTLSGQKLLIGSPLVSAALVPVAHWLAKRLGATAPGDWIARLKALGLKAATALVATVLVVVLLTFWVGLAYALTAKLASGAVVAGFKGHPVAAYWTLLGLVAALNLTIGFVLAFLNLSSLLPFYASRLRRAYLGASNKSRFDKRSKMKGVEALDTNDEVALADYFGAERAPLHLINITLNETMSEGSNLVQRDRHGRNLLLSAAGMFFSQGPNDVLNRVALINPGGLTDHDDKARLQLLDARFCDAKYGEPVPMSTWVAISGAAFSTGLGAQTSFGMAMLAGLANIRLGYWWGRDPTAPWERILRQMFGKVMRKADANAADEPPLDAAWLREKWRRAAWWPIQFYLFNEFRGHFTGADLQRWYLTDGGHFENTAVYELIRRELPFIIACDNGADGSYGFDDLANLVRKARIDFDAEIEFLDDADLGRQFRNARQLRAAFRDQRSYAATKEDRAVAMLARIRYRSGKTGTLLVIKARLTGHEPVDLVNYHGANAEFPQQTTLDQFFDEAQWESYHKLGRLAARRLFGQDHAGWNPRDLKPLPPARERQDDDD